MKNQKGHSTIGYTIGIILTVVIGLLAGIGFVNVVIWGADKAMQRIEKSECEKWAGEAKQFPNYYQTDWQVEQCIRYNIVIDAPVK
jgi:hypothetical protein